MDLKYEDFDVQVLVDKQGKHLVTVGCLQGSDEGYIDLSAQLFTQDVSAIAAKVTRTSKARGHSEQAQVRPEEFEAFGRDLFSRLLPDTLAHLFVATRAVAENSGKGMRIRLRTKDPAVARLPWELLYSPRDGFLCLSDRTPVIRHPSVPRPVAPLETGLPLRVLAVMSNSATEPLNLQEEKYRVEQAFGQLREHNLLRLVWFEQGTPDALREKLEEFAPHILHFAGHGEFNELAGEGQIILQDESGGPVPLSAAALALLLKDVRSLRLVFLNSCEGAREGGKALSSTAWQLIAAGIPAVIAMQFEISDDVAIHFAEKVYRQLCRNRPVDAAVTEARLAIRLGNSFEWSTPVLYLSPSEAVLFHFDAGSRGPEPDKKAEEERLAREKAEKEEAERLAREKAEKAEKERLVRGKAEKAEKERLVREKAEKAEKERLAREKAERDAKRAAVYLRAAKYGAVALLGGLAVIAWLRTRQGTFPPSYENPCDSRPEASENVKHIRSALCRLENRDPCGAQLALDLVKKPDDSRQRDLIEGKRQEIEGKRQEISASLPRIRIVNAASIPFPDDVSFRICDGHGHCWTSTTTETPVCPGTVAVLASAAGMVDFLSRSHKVEANDEVVPILVALRPEVGPPPGGGPPRPPELVSGQPECPGRPGEPETGCVTVESLGVPPRELLLDGRPIPSNAEVHPVSPGSHTITATWPGGFHHSDAIEVAPGRLRPYRLPKVECKTDNNRTLCRPVP